MPTPDQLWPKVIDDLDRIGTLAQTDGRSIGRYCVILSQWLQSKAFIEKSGEHYPIQDEAGNLIKFGTFPQAQAFKHLLTQLLRLEQEFGLTPSSRAGLSVAPRKTDEDLEARYFG